MKIKEGINSAKKLEEYNSLSDAAYLRAKEDYLIGINFSRLLSIIYGKGLAKILNQDRASISIGRVMTCVLGMIVKREIEIRNFKKVNFYKIQGVFGENEKITADWKAVNTSKYFENPKLYNETGFKLKKDAESLISEIKNSDYGTIKEVSKKTQKENAPLLYNLAEIQNECSKRFKITPEETLNIIQELYEKKLVTYPRTDARVLSTAIAKEIKKNLNGLFKSNIDNEIKKCLNKMIEEKYNTNLLKSKYVDDSKITDHYAIIPTGQGFENYGNLENLKKEIYHLIVRRFLSVFYPPAEYNKINVKIDVGGEEFNANCKICIKQGYLEVLKKYKSNEMKIYGFNNKMLQKMI